MAASYKVSLSLDIKNFVNGLKSVKSSIKSAESAFKGFESSSKSLKTVGNSVDKLVSKVGGLATALGKVSFAAFATGTALLTKSFFDINKELERTEVLMQGAVGSVSGAEKAFGDLIDFTRQVPFTLADTTNAFVQLKVAGIDPLDGSLLAISDAVSAFGGTSQNLELTILALRQMMGKGAVSMEELRRQLGEQVPSAIYDMAEALDMEYEALTKLVSAGELASDIAVPALLEFWSEKFAGSSLKMMTSMYGALNNLTTSWQVFMRNIGKTGIWQAAVDVMLKFDEVLWGIANNAQVMDFFDDLGLSVSIWVDELVEGLPPADEMIANTIETVGELKDSFFALLGGARDFIDWYSSDEGIASIKNVTSGAISFVIEEFKVLSAFLLQLQKLEAGSIDMLDFAMTDRSESLAQYEEWSKATKGMSTAQKVATIEMEGMGAAAEELERQLAEANEQLAGAEKYKGPTGKAALIETATKRVEDLTTKMDELNQRKVELDIILNPGTVNTDVLDTYVEDYVDNAHTQAVAALDQFDTVAAEISKKIDLLSPFTLIDELPDVKEFTYDVKYNVWVDDVGYVYNPEDVFDNTGFKLEGDIYTAGMSVKFMGFEYGGSESDSPFSMDQYFDTDIEEFVLPRLNINGFKDSTADFDKEAKAAAKIIEQLEDIVADAEKAWADAEFDLNTSGMSDYNMAVAESEQALREEIKAIKDLNAVKADEEKTIASVTEASGKELEAKLALIEADALATLETKNAEKAHESLRLSMSAVDKLYDDVASSVKDYTDSKEYQILVDKDAADGTDLAAKSLEEYKGALESVILTSEERADAAQEDWEKEVDAIKKTEDAVAGFKAGLTDSIKEMRTLGEVGYDTAQDISDAMSDNLSDSMTYWVSGFDDAVEALDDTYTDAVENAADTYADSLADLDKQLAENEVTYEEYYDSLEDLQTTYNDAVLDAQETYHEDYKEAEEKLGFDLESLWDDVFESILDNATDWAADMVVKIGSDLVSELLSGDIWGSLSEFWDGLGDTMGSLLSGDWSSAGDSLGSMFGSLFGDGDCVKICDGGVIGSAIDSLGDTVIDLAAATYDMSNATSALETSASLAATAYNSTSDTVLSGGDASSVYSQVNSTVDLAVSDGTWNAVETKWATAADDVTAYWSESMSRSVSNYDWSSASVKSSTEFNQMLDGTYDMTQSTFDATKNLNEFSTSLSGMSESVKDSINTSLDEVMKDDSLYGFNTETGWYSELKAELKTGAEDLVGGAENLTTITAGLQTAGGLYGTYSGVTGMMEDGVTVGNSVETGMGLYNTYQGLSTLAPEMTAAMSEGVVAAGDTVAGWFSTGASELGAGVVDGAVTGAEVIATEVAKDVVVSEGVSAAAGESAAGAGGASAGMAASATYAALAYTAYRIVDGILTEDYIDTTSAAYGIGDKDSYDGTSGQWSIEVDQYTEAMQEALNELEAGVGDSWAALNETITPSAESVDAYTESVTGLNLSLEQSSGLMDQAVAGDLTELTTTLTEMGASETAANAAALGLVNALDTTTTAAYTSAIAAEAFGLSVSESADGFMTVAGGAEEAKESMDSLGNVISGGMDDVVNNVQSSADKISNTTFDMSASGSITVDVAVIGDALADANADAMADADIITMGYAKGGLLTGGSGVRDDLYLGKVGGSAIVAQGGEYIMNPDSTAKYLPMLEAMNAKTFATGGMLPLYIPRGKKEPDRPTTPEIEKMPSWMDPNEGATSDVFDEDKMEDITKLIENFNDTIADSTLNDYVNSVRDINSEYDEYLQTLKDSGASLDDVRKAEYARSLELVAAEQKRQDSIDSILDSYNKEIDDSLSAKMDDAYDSFMASYEKMVDAGATQAELNTLTEEYNRQLQDVSDTYADLVSDFMQPFNDMVGDLTDTEKAVRDLNDSYADSIERAKELGLSQADLATIEEARVKELQNMRDAIVDDAVATIDRDAMSDTEYAMEEINKGYDDMRDNLIALGATQSELSIIEQARNVELQGMTQDIMDGINDTIDKDTMTDSEYAAKGINEEYDLMLESLLALGATQEQLRKLEEARQIELANSGGDSLDEYYEDLANMGAKVSTFGAYTVPTSTYDDRPIVVNAVLQGDTLINDQALTTTVMNVSDDNAFARDRRDYNGRTVNSGVPQ